MPRSFNDRNDMQDRRDEADMEARQLRRMRAEDRALARREKQEARIDRECLIGELCRDGKPVYYFFPAGGKYREGTKGEVIDYIIRRGFV